MAVLSDESITDRMRHREKLRATNVSSRLTTAEALALDELAQKRGLQRGELIRQLILRELRNESDKPKVSAELIETIGLRLILTNLLKPIATGQKIPSEIFDAIMTEVRRTKREVAVEAQRLQEGL